MTSIICTAPGKPHSALTFPLQLHYESTLYNHSISEEKEPRLTEVKRLAPDHTAIRSYSKKLKKNLWLKSSPLSIPDA